MHSFFHLVQVSKAPTRIAAMVLQQIVYSRRMYLYPIIVSEDLPPGRKVFSNVTKGT